MYKNMNKKINKNFEIKKGMFAQLSEVLKGPKNKETQKILEDLVENQYKSLITTGKNIDRVPFPNNKFSEYSLEVFPDLNKLHDIKYSALTKRKEMDINMCIIKLEKLIIKELEEKTALNKLNENEDVNKKGALNELNGDEDVHKKDLYADILCNIFKKVDFDVFFGKIIYTFFNIVTYHEFTDSDKLNSYNGVTNILITMGEYIVDKYIYVLYNESDKKNIQFKEFKIKMGALLHQEFFFHVGSHMSKIMMDANMIEHKIHIIDNDNKKAYYTLTKNAKK
jgi:hypothetical protein